jgi:hypothetical protein
MLPSRGPPVRQPQPPARRRPARASAPEGVIRAVTQCACERSATGCENHGTAQFRTPRPARHRQHRLTAQTGNGSSSLWRRAIPMDAAEVDCRFDACAAPDCLLRRSAQKRVSSRCHAGRRAASSLRVREPETSLHRDAWMRVAGCAARGRPRPSWEQPSDGLAARLGNCIHAAGRMS